MNRKFWIGISLAAACVALSGSVMAADAAGVAEREATWTAPRRISRSLRQRPRGLRRPAAAHQRSDIKLLNGRECRGTQIELSTLVTNVECKGAREVLATHINYAGVRSVP